MVEKFPRWDNLYDKPDMERLGIFSEMPYMNGKKYVSLFPKPKVTKGRNIMGEGPKSKCGTQAGYFDNEFRRLFIGEALRGRGRKPNSILQLQYLTEADILKAVENRAVRTKPHMNNVTLPQVSRCYKVGRTKVGSTIVMRKRPRFKPVSKMPLMPPATPKKINTPGGYFGTFRGNIEAFSNRRRKAPDHQKQPKNFLTNPGKKGGCGYLNICLEKYPLHTVDRYGDKKPYKEYGFVLNGPMRTNAYPQPYFHKNPYPDPPKMKPGPTYVKPQEREHAIVLPGFVIPPGIHKLPGVEYFEPFPEYKSNKYITAYDLIKPRRHKGGIFYPHSMAEKTFYTTSTVSENVRFRITNKNYSSYEPSYIKHLVK